MLALMIVVVFLEVLMILLSVDKVIVWSGCWLQVWRCGGVNSVNVVNVVDGVDVVDGMNGVDDGDNLKSVNVGGTMCVG